MGVGGGGGGGENIFSSEFQSPLANGNNGSFHTALNPHQSCPRAPLASTGCSGNIVPYNFSPTPCHQRLAAIGGQNVPICFFYVSSRRTLRRTGLERM